MAEVAAIGWVVAPMIKAMVANAVSYVEGQYDWHRHVGDDLRELQLALSKIQTAVTAAQRQRQQTRDNTHLEQWLHQIKDAVYEANDVLDEFEYRRMKAQAEREEGRVSRIFSSSLTFGKQLIGVDDFRTTLKKMLRVLNSIGDSISALLQAVGLEHATVHHQGTEIEPSRETSSIPPPHNQIFGRKKEKEQIVGLLLKPADEPESSNRKCIPVIPIVGLGGLGKTTLAQLVYNDSRIVDHFDTRIWVCVSDSFNEIKLTRSMLESLSGSDQKYNDAMHLDTIQKDLQTKLESKRFLLVLDDVWLDEERKIWENKERWAKVFTPLNQAAVGSMVLVTTRMDTVAKMFEATNRLTLGGLENEEYWSLFKSYAFGDENANKDPSLEEIGRQIAKRLCGSPLAAKAIGVLLKNKLAVKEWKETLERETLDDIASILKLSYQHLPDRLKHCFAFCSIFPKDWQFQPEKLVLLWIAQDYIQTPDTNDRLMVDIGMDYFNELLSRSFFEKVKRDSHTYYVIHDLIHDLAQFVAKTECFRIDSRKQSTIRNTIRHLGVVASSEEEVTDILIQLRNFSNLKKLRTLIFFHKWDLKSGDLLLGMFKKAKSLRVLDFDGLHVSPRDLDHLLHLRYLNLSTNYFKNLSESWCGLYHLQVLAALGRVQLSESIFRLIKFGKLSRFDVPWLEYKVGKKRGHGIGVLKAGMKVVFEGQVCITNLENVACKEEAIEADLASKQYLYALELQWDFQERINKRHDACGEVAEALKPHPNLKELTIRGFGGIRSPSWLETKKWLFNVQTIHLADCKNLEALPPLGHLSLPKELRIQGMDAIKQVGSEFYDCNENESEGVRVGFPSLEVLWFINMPEWSKWSGVEFPVFPHLRQLTVDRCPKLVSLPGGALLLSLESLNIVDSDVSDASLSRSLQGLTLLSRLTICDCRKLTSLGALGALSFLKRLIVVNCSGVRSLPEEGLPASIERLELQGCEELTSLGGLGALTSLKYLMVSYCPRVKSLPEEGLPASIECLELQGCEELTSLRGLGALTSLRHLEVNYCPRVKSLPEEGLPASIEFLTLCGCDPALQQQLREKEGPEWDKAAHIPDIEVTHRHETWKFISYGDLLL